VVDEDRLAVDRPRAQARQGREAPGRVDCGQLVQRARPGGRDEVRAGGRAAEVEVLLEERAHEDLLARDAAQVRRGAADLEARADPLVDALAGERLERWVEVDDLLAVLDRLLGRERVAQGERALDGHAHADVAQRGPGRAAGETEAVVGVQPELGECRYERLVAAVLERGVHAIAQARAPGVARNP
jgi:hypothetical protein